jgi:histone acetyltransferase (RNA polymerase elongator complex component)
MPRQAGLVIPVFLPMAGCPRRCIFCNQASLHPRSVDFPDENSIRAEVEKYLGWSKKRPVHLAFYGGNFCGLSREEKEVLLRAARALKGEGLIDSFRASTRPDSIDAAEARFLRDGGVSFVEIGAQSFEDEVLLLSSRGHTSKDVETALEALKAAGVGTGIHLMCGLPGSTFEGDVRSAERTAALKPDTARIHPTLVLKGAPLEDDYHAGRYVPLTLDEAARRCAAMMEILEKGGVRVSRVGLHGDDELLTGRALVAGPLHPSLRELARRVTTCGKQRTPPR